MSLIPEIGCLACATSGKYRLAQVHHIVETNRLGHAATIGLCPWHHMGQLGESGSVALFGPSLAENKRDFVALYGTERELLELQDSLILAFERNWVGGKEALVRSYNTGRLVA